MILLALCELDLSLNFTLFLFFQMDWTDGEPTKETEKECFHFTNPKFLDPFMDAASAKLNQAGKTCINVYQPFFCFVGTLGQPLCVTPRSVFPNLFLGLRHLYLMLKKYGGTSIFLVAYLAVPYCFMVPRLGNTALGAEIGLKVIKVIISNTPGTILKYPSVPQHPIWEPLTLTFASDDVINVTFQFIRLTLHKDLKVLLQIKVEFLVRIASLLSRFYNLTIMRNVLQKDFEI